MDGTVGTIRGVARLTHGRRWYRVLHLGPELLAVLGCIAIIWGAVAFTLVQAHDAAVASARRETATLARAFAESSNRISTVLDRELLALRASFAEKGSAFDVARWVRPSFGAPPKRTTSCPSRCHASPTVKENVSMPPTSRVPGMSNVALGRKMPIFMTSVLSPAHSSLPPTRARTKAS